MKNFNQSLKMLSGNEFSELHSLIYNIQKEIQEYCHVSDLLPNSFKNEFLKLQTALEKEYENRDSKY